MFVSCCCWCVQGQKGEPGLILGPDGKPQYIGGLGGAPVGRATTFQPHSGQFVVIQTLMLLLLCRDLQGDPGPPGLVGPPVRTDFLLATSLLLRQKHNEIKVFSVQGAFGPSGPKGEIGLPGRHVSAQTLLLPPVSPPLIPMISSCLLTFPGSAGSERGQRGARRSRKWLWTSPPSKSCPPPLSQSLQSSVSSSRNFTSCSSGSTRSSWASWTTRACSSLKWGEWA